jgi:hypothetical protein
LPFWISTYDDDDDDNDKAHTPAMPRKTTGCWTCRARKKKCDDGRPSCAACTLRAITCYGYEAKPAWMDGGDEEKDMLRTMKQRAKESYSQRRRARAMRSARQGSMSTMAMSTSTASPGGMRSEYGESSAALTTANSGSSGGRDQQQQQQQQQPDSRHFDMRPADQASPNNPHHHNCPSQQHNHDENYGHHAHNGHGHGHPGPMEPHASYTAHPSYTSHPSHTLHPSHPPQNLYDPHHFQDAPLPAIYEPAKATPHQLPRSRSPLPRDGIRSGSDFPYSENDLSLLMYYFDHVFPRLCPFFVYSAGDKGRGWLLSLFLRTKPLCAAAICISACDQAQFVLGPLSDMPEGTNHDLEVKHIEIVVDLRAHLAQLSQQTGASRMAVAVEALACVMHLIFFEVCTTMKTLFAYIFLPLTI